MKFSAFNLKKELVDALEKLSYVEPTKVQEVVIPKALKNENIIVQSETGSGKTHSFLIPAINNIEINKKPQVLIISPTRELARQTYNFAIEFKQYFTDLTIKLFVSGEDSKEDIKSFKNGAEIIIATPGKLDALLKEDVDLSFVKTIILDEADMLIDKTFLDVIDSLISKLNDYQIEVFSATISKQVEIFLKKYISPDYVLTLDENNSTSKTVSHHFINTKHNDLFESVIRFIKIKNPFLLLIFASSKKEVKELYAYLLKNKYKCGILSGDLESRERKSMLRRINKLEFQIVVCSDIASRGLDIENVSEVLSLNLPSNLEYYYHRAGRTGRNYKTGDSYIFYDQDHLTLPIKLLETGLNVDYLKFSDDKLVEDLPLKQTKKPIKKTNVELDKAIKKAKSSVNTKKVKPGYKKKVKLAVDKAKKKYKREIIKKDIRRQRVERYKEEAKRNG